MTIKEAFEALSSACAKGMKNPFFVMKRLKESFADVADKVVDAGGSVVSVTAELTEGTKIATVTVDGEDTDLYAPEGGSGGVDYSTTEQDTGLKWIDDSKIYQLTISQIATNRTAEVDLTSYGIKEIIEAHARIKAGDYTEFPGYYGASNDFSYIYYQDSNKKIRVDYGSGLSTGASVYLTIRYIKSST